MTRLRGAWRGGSDGASRPRVDYNGAVAVQTIERRVIRALERAVGRDGVLWRPEEVLAFEYDGTIEKARPQAVVLPTSAQQVAEVVRVALDAGLPVVPRGAGTGLGGGAGGARGGGGVG